MCTVACPPPASLGERGDLGDLHVGAKEGEAAESEAREGEGGVVTRHGLQSCNRSLRAICAQSVVNMALSLCAPTAASCLLRVGRGVRAQMVRDRDRSLGAGAVIVIQVII